MDALKLRAVLGLDKKEYDEGLKSAENIARSSGSKIGSFLTGTAKAVGAGLAVATAATGALVKSSVDAYSEFEQLQGGIETLFGESANVVMENAKKAYKTAGKDANDYMNTVVGMAGALNKATGDVEKSAELADMAIVDMSDNVNKMGTSMEMVQNAYTGFSRGNFTMLDNLALGFAGTKEGMQELLDSAQAISGVQYDISSYADIVEAIHVVQTEMGITGTTSKEAATTIQGSINMTAEAWQNLVTGLTNPDADISQLIDNLVESAKAAASNLIPAIGQALTGVVELVKGVIPVITEELPALIEEILPMLLEAGVELFNGLIDALPELMNALFEQLPMVVQSLIDTITKLLPMVISLGGQFIMSLAEGFLQALPTIMPQIMELINGLVEMLSDPSGLEEFVNTAVQIITTLAQGLIEALPVLIPAVAQIILNLVTALTQPDNLSTLMITAVELIIALAEGIIKAIPDLLKAAITLLINLVLTFESYRAQMIEKGKELITKLIDGIKAMFSKAKEKAKELIDKIIDGIKAKFTEIKEKGKELVDNVKNGFMEKVEGAKQWGKDLIDNFINGLKEKWENLKSTVSDIASSIKDYLGFSEPKLGPLSNFHTYAPDMMDLFMEGVKDNKDKLLATVADAFNFNPIFTEGNDYDIIGSGSNTDLYGMLEQIVTMLPQLANNQIVLDTGILVGETAPKMNQALGTLYSREQRSV